MQKINEREVINKNPNASLIAVSEDFAEDMLGCLPPVYFKNGLYTVFQVGEASDHDINGFPVYETYIRMNEEAVTQCCGDSRMEINQWYFTGNHKQIK